VLHQIGVGALGPVFRTYEPTRDRLVAVKVFRLDVTPEQAQALADELSVAADAGLFHPSVVEPIAAGVEGTVAYRAEEYVAAETLDVALRHYAPAPIDKVLPLITQLAGAIDFARTAGVGHGALHPRDIFVAPDEARATGFGVVEALERVGLRAPVRRPYSAPERVGGTSWSTPADVFSLAAIAYELLTGRRPAGTGSQIGAVTGSTAGHYPGFLHAVFVQAMDEDPARRHQSALAFASALDGAARGEAPVALGHSAVAGVAGLAATARPEEIEEAVGDLPPLEDVDTRTDPALAEEEEEVFRTEEPDFDDLMSEKGADDAHSDRLLLEEDQDDEQDEAVESLALDKPETRFAAVADPDEPNERDEFDEFDEIDELETGDNDGAEIAAHAPVPITPFEEDDERAAAYLPEGDREAVRHDRPRPPMLAIAVGLVLALLVFAAGYLAGKRAPEPAIAADTSEAPVAGEQASESARPYSEESVSAARSPGTTAAPAVATGAASPSGEPESAPEPSERGTPPTTGRVVVRSTPSGANVTVDGRWRGRTPLTLDALPFGSHQLRVVRPGYRVAAEDFSLSAGTPSRTLSFRLQRSAPAARPRAAAPARSQTATPQSFTGSVYVDSRPRGATVIIDGKSMGTTPVRIPEVRIGSHVIRLQLADHSDWTTSTRVVSGQEARVTGSLERIR
jgi:serine/threonine protein kinase